MAELTGSARSIGDLQSEYMAQVRHKRILNLILVLVFLAMMLTGFRVANQRNAGGFW
ncbi:MAG: phosphonate transport system permease protein, partial [Paracoccaceae bacterium]